MRRSLRLSSVGLAVNDVSKPPVTNFSHKFSLGSFTRRVQQLTEEQKSAIKKTGLGSLLLIPNHSLSKVLLTEWMERWNCEKQAFVLDLGEIRMTLLDAALILGLRVLGKPVVLRDEEPFSELEESYGASEANRNVEMKSLEERLDSIGGVLSDDFVRTFLLFSIGTFLSSNGKVDSRYLSFLRDLDEVCEFSWGAAVVEDLAHWLNKRKEDNRQCVGGCLIFLQIWSFEHFDIARPQLQGHDLTFPRVCRWDNRKKTIPREKVTSWFKDLTGDKVIWTLQPTESELQLEIMKEALEVMSDSTELESAENSLASTSGNVHEVDSKSQLSISSKEHREEEEVYSENMEVEDTPKKRRTRHGEHTEPEINLENLIVLDTPPKLSTCNGEYREPEINTENQVVEDTPPTLSTSNGEYGENENPIVEDTPSNLSYCREVHGQQEMNLENLIVDDTPTSSGIADEVTTELKRNARELVVDDSTEKLNLSDDELRKRCLMLEGENVELKLKVGQVMEKSKQFEEENAELKKELDRMREEIRELTRYRTFAKEFETHLWEYENETNPSEQ